MGAGAREGRSGAERSMRLARPQYSSHFPLVRLLQLVVLLQTERCPNARRLAEISEVSRRTIYRDFAALVEAGIPVVYQADRQGYELSRTLFLQPLRIADREAVALMVLCRRWDDDDLGLGEMAGRAVSKVIQSLADASRTRLSNAMEVLGCAGGGGLEPTEWQSVQEAIFEGISQRKQVRVWFQELDAAEPEATKLAIYRLARIAGHWAVVGRSSRHCRVITLPLHRVVRAELTADETQIPPRFNLRRYLTSQVAMPEPLSQASSG
jgi:predicted DNA-binding transcriptional regulator YafY